LQASITSEALLAHSQKLEDFAYATPQRNRLIGTKGHNDTIQYLYDTLSSLNGYYKVELQPFTTLVQTNGTFNFSANGVEQSVGAMEFSPSGNITAPLVVVANRGCDPVSLLMDLTSSFAWILTFLISRATTRRRYPATLHSSQEESANSVSRAL
jgi:hypothetical protein